MTDLNKSHENGTPLHACNGNIQDAHYWAWLNTSSFELYMRNVLGAYRRGEAVSTVEKS